MEKEDLETYIIQHMRNVISDDVTREDLEVFSNNLRAWLDLEEDQEKRNYILGHIDRMEGYAEKTSTCYSYFDKEGELCCKEYKVFTKSLFLFREIFSEALRAITSGDAYFDFLSRFTIRCDIVHTKLGLPIIIGKTCNLSTFIARAFETEDMSVDDVYVHMKERGLSGRALTKNLIKNFLNDDTLDAADLTLEIDWQKVIQELLLEYKDEEDLRWLSFFEDASYNSDLMYASILETLDGAPLDEPWRAGVELTEDDLVALRGELAEPLGILNGHREDERIRNAGPRDLDNLWRELIAGGWNRPGNVPVEDDANYFVGVDPVQVLRDHLDSDVSDLDEEELDLLSLWVMNVFDDEVPELVALEPEPNTAIDVLNRVRHVLPEDLARRLENLLNDIDEDDFEDEDDLEGEDTLLALLNSED